MMTPAAPAICALLIFVSRTQLPRWISAILFVSEPAGNAVHPNPSLPMDATSTTCLVRGRFVFGPFPKNAFMVWPPIDRVCQTRCLLVEAPTVIASGMVPGVVMLPIAEAEPRSPLFPAGTTTTIPLLIAFRTATIHGSQKPSTAVELPHTSVV